jgi:acyl carrier protein
VPGTQYGWTADFEDLLRLAVPGIAAIAPDTDLIAQGLGSLQIVQLLVSLEDHYGFVLEDEELDFEMFATPQTLWQAVTVARSRSGAGGEG